MAEHWFMSKQLKGGTSVGIFNPTHPILVDRSADCH